MKQQQNKTSTLDITFFYDDDIDNDDKNENRKKRIKNETKLIRCRFNHGIKNPAINYCVIYFFLSHSLSSLYIYNIMKMHIFLFK